MAALQDDHASAATAFRRSLSLLAAGGVDPRDIGPVARAAAEVTTQAADVDALLATMTRLIGDLTARGATSEDTRPGHGSELAKNEARLDDAEARELGDQRAHGSVSVGGGRCAGTTLAAIAPSTPRHRAR